MKKLTLILLAIVALVSACSKYEEGPGLSLLSKKARLAGTWKITDYIDNGQPVIIDETDDLFYERLVFEKDGTGKSYYIGASSGEQGSEQNPYVLQWEFENDNEDLRITDTYNESIIIYKIIRLANKEVILQYTDDEDTYRITLEPAE